eukprot:tig00000269_g23735.t1
MSGHKSKSHASKRARVEQPAAPPAPAPVPLQGAGQEAFDALPDAVVSDVFKALGLRESWHLRGVCRRWRRVVEETEWASVELRIEGGDATDWTGGKSGKRRKAAGGEGAGGPGGERVYSLLTELFEARKLRLGGSAGCSVALRAEFPRPPTLRLGKSGDVAAVEKSHQLAASAACGLLATIAGRVCGPAQLREATVELINASRIRRATRKLLRDVLLGVLRALAPQDGAASALECLSVGFTGGPGSDDSESDRFMPWPEPDELRTALAPFGKLRSLTLFFNELDEGAALEAAAAIAEACPLLRSLALGPGEDAALAALAPLAHLEELVVEWPPPTRDSNEPRALAALADKPAGRSLRRIALFRSTGLYRCGRSPLGLPNLDDPILSRRTKYS